MQAVATGDNSKYRVPMGVGEPHAELDAAKKGCTVVDVVVSEDAFEEFRTRCVARCGPAAVLP